MNSNTPAVPAFRIDRRRGSRNPNARLTAEDVLDARAAAPTMPQRTIARALKVSPSCISRAVNAVTWRHLPEARPRAELPRPAEALA
jgi:DNA-binding MurR/RpiR family transcriptional regulator